MNKFNNNPINNIVENMNNNYMNYQKELKSSVSTESFNPNSQKNENLQETNNVNNNNVNSTINSADINKDNNFANILNNPMFKTLLSNSGGNINNILPLLNGGNNSLNANNKNELLMQLLTKQMNNTGSTKVQNKEVDIESLPKINDYNIL